MQVNEEVDTRLCKSCVCANCQISSRHGIAPSCEKCGVCAGIMRTYCANCKPYPEKGGDFRL
jgi:hypothetical protein